MKILRSVTRRGFSIGSAGLFSILKPNTWFPATRLPGPHQGFGAPVKKTKGAAGASALNGMNGQARSVQWRVIDQRIEEHYLMRSGIIILGALAITAAMLWWIMHP